MQDIPTTEENWIQGRGYRKQILVQQDELKCPGALVQIVEIDPQNRVPFHYHKSSHEVFHVLDGTGAMTIAGKKHTLSRGDTLTCIPPQIHDACNDSRQVWRFIVFKTNAYPEDIFWLD